MKNYFVCGIGTGVGKTIVAGILTEALKADYWKPVQCGDLDSSDTLMVKSLITNTETTFYKEKYAFKTPVSPHLAADIEGVEISLDAFTLPHTDNSIIIEGAGGVFVPLNHRGDMVLDLIKHLNAEAIIVSRNYLGSINHTLLTFNALKLANIKIAGIVFNGDENSDTESFILNYTSLLPIGKVRTEKHLNKELVLKYANAFNINLLR